MHERNFRGITGTVEHALAEKRASETDAVEPADQFVAVIDLDGVAVTPLVKLSVEIANAGIDPGASSGPAPAPSSHRVPRQSHGRRRR